MTEREELLNMLREMLADCDVMMQKCCAIIATASAAEALLRETEDR